MADAGDVRALMELERRVGAELVARGIVAQTALAPLHAEGRARGTARGGSFLAGAVLARRLASLDVIDAVLRGSELEPGERTVALDGPPLRPPAAQDGERTLTFAGPPLSPVPAADSAGGRPGSRSGATAWGDDAQPPRAPARVDATRLSLGDEVARARPPEPAPADRTFAPDLEEGVTAADVPTDGRTWMPFDGGSATFPGPPSRRVGPASVAPQVVRYALPDGLTEGPQRAVDQQLAREVTLHAGAPGDVAAVQRAARVLAQLDHPGVPRVHDVGELQGRPYYTTDRLSGAPLGAGDEPPLPALLRAFLDVGAAVAHAHRAGVVHGSLAPERVVLGAAGEVWVTGWGEGQGAAPTDDVQGLGRVLEGVLRAGRVRPPWALQAVTRAAAKPGGTYATADALVEDVRRFLDGEGVIAETEWLPRLLLRLARRHPAPAAVVGVILLALAGIGAWAGLGLRAASVAATKAGDDARDQIRTKERESERARENARAARESAEAAGARLRLEDALALAQDATARAADVAPVVSAFAVAERVAEGIAGAGRLDALARVRERRARWALDAGLPEEALADLGDGPGASEEALVLRFLAARRSPGAAAEAAAARALALLSETDGPLSALARGLIALAPLEAERARLDEGASPGQAVDDSDLVARARPLLAPLEKAVAALPGLALAHETFGRALALGMDPGLGCREFVVATQLDPADPESRLRMVEVWQREMGIHDRRRWIAGWWRRQLAGATKLTRRPQPLLALARMALTQHDRAGALLAADRLLALPRPDGAEAAAWDEAELFAARARMELKGDPGPGLARLRPGPGVDAPRLHALRAWAALRSGAHQEGLREVNEALAGMWRQDEAPLRDVVEACAAATTPFTDEEWEPFLDSLERSKLSPDLQQGWAVDWLILAHGRALSLRGLWGELQALLDSHHPGKYISAESQLAKARVGRFAGSHAEAHFDALLAWSQVGVDIEDLRSTAHDARAFLVRALREAGKEEAATAFEQVDVEEPTTPRAWGP